MRRLLSLILLSVVAAPLGAQADGSIQIVAAGGAAKPFGDRSDGVKLSDDVDWAFPLDGQLQFRIVKQLSLGGYVRYAPMTVPSSCTGCSANDLAFGGRLEYRFDEKLEGGGWLGVFGGYEQTKFESGSGTAKTSITYSGPEGGVAGGMDFELGGLTLGPYVQLTMGEYTSRSGGTGSSTLASKGMHAFFGAGIRLALLL